MKKLFNILNVKLRDITKKSYFIKDIFVSFIFKANS